MTKGTSTNFQKGDQKGSEIPFLLIYPNSMETKIVVLMPQFC